ncbi:MAG TPA: 3-phosphoshikimate 1-carboxyvinyltransferase [Nitrososphaeraceae archaeon]|nr:3-phosphoshikimate 1-carboxyvinyltransferase [Nitrososphaeraceae archaeon]
MTKLEIRKSFLEGNVKCPSSKSYTHRAIAIASLAEGKSTISNPLISRDTIATISGCKMLGIKIEKANENVNCIEILGKNQFESPKDIINAENSGTTIRILTSMAALVKNGYTILTGDESLKTRPMKPLISALNQLGVQAFSSNEKNTPPLIVKGGGIKGGLASIEGGISSQFISSLLISCIYGLTNVEIRVKEKQVSIPYINSTIETMKKFGVAIKHDKEYSNYYITNTRYRPTHFTIPGDFSSASLIIAAGVLCGGKISIEGMNFHYPQGDMEIIDIVRKMGGEITVNKEKGEVNVYGSNSLDGIECNLVNCPDLLPAVSIISLKSRKPVRIFGISHARFKETDRISIITKELRKMGVHISEKEDELLLNPVRRLKNVEFDSHNDHRLFMAFTIASMLTNKSTVRGAESIDVSYPSFIHEIKRLGGNVKLTK